MVWGGKGLNSYQGSAALRPILLCYSAGPAKIKRDPTSALFEGMEDQ
jgi:hypothetical protein